MKRRTKLAMGAVVVLVVVGAFFGGRAFAAGTPTPAEALKVLQNLTAAQRQALAQSGTSGTQSGAPTSGSSGGGVTSGTIVSSDADSLVVKTSDGSTKLVIYSGSTSISVTKTGSNSDFTKGEQVRVAGTTNSDGSITATEIQCGKVTVGTPPSGGNAGTGTASTGSNSAAASGSASDAGSTAGTGAGSGDSSSTATTAQ